MNAPLSPHRPPRNYPLMALGMLGGLGFAAYLNAHLGDFTAERGWRAALQVAAVSLAFGAMAQLVVEAAIRAVQGLQNDLDALTAGRERHRDTDDGA